MGAEYGEVAGEGVELPAGHAVEKLGWSLDGQVGGGTELLGKPVAGRWRSTGKDAVRTGISPCSNVMSPWHNETAEHCMPQNYQNV